MVVASGIQAVQPQAEGYAYAEIEQRLENQHLATGSADQSAFTPHCSSAPVCNIAEVVGEMFPTVMA